MLVTVTGGTGFVGAHSTAAMVRNGHRVRLLVRDEALVGAALSPLGVDASAVDVFVGDILDRRALDRAMRGAEAVLHAAAVYSFDSRAHAAMRRVNERGTELVLGAALAAGADLVIHVSSVAALFPAAEGVVHEETPVGSPREVYMASKAAADRVARRHQAAGDPVVITYPPALLGPCDPHLGDQTARLRDLLRGLMPIWPGGGFPVGDVRDTAELHAVLLDWPKDGINRYFGAGRHLTTREYVKAVRDVTGRRLPAMFVPPRALLPLGMAADLVQHAWPWHIPAPYGAVYTCAHAAPVAPDAETLGIRARPIAATLADTVRWLCEQGHLTPRQAGLPGVDALGRVGEMKR